MNTIKVLWGRFQMCLAGLTYCFSKHPMKRDFLDMYLTTFSGYVTSKIQKLWGWSFFSKCLKFKLNFKNAVKNFEKFFCFWDNCIWIGIVKYSLWGTRYFSSSANVSTSSPNIFHVKKGDLFQLNLLWRNRWIWSRCFDADFNSAWARLPFCWSKGPLKRAFLDIYLTTFSQSVISEIQKLWRSSFDSKCLKFNTDFKNGAKNSEKVFCFSDNCIWIGIVKLSLSRTGYFSSTANVLRSSPKIWDFNKRDFFQINFLVSDQWIWSKWCEALFKSAWEPLPCCLSKGPLNWDFLDIYLTMLSECVISKMESLWGSSFFFKIHFWNLAEILIILQKNMTLIDFLFPKWGNPKR